MLKNISSLLSNLSNLPTLINDDSLSWPKVFDALSMRQNGQVKDWEFLLRRVSTNPKYYDESKERMPISRYAFQPDNKRDTDGLSLFRKFFLKPSKLAKSGPSPNGYYVAQVRKTELTNLSLTVIPNPIKTQLKGHSLIPEIRKPYTSKEDEEKSKSLQLKLAQLVNNNEIFGPYKKK